MCHDVGTVAAWDATTAGAIFPVRGLEQGRKAVSQSVDVGSKVTLGGGIPSCGRGACNGSVGCMQRRVEGRNLRRPVCREAAQGLVYAAQEASTNGRNA